MQDEQIENLKNAVIYRDNLIADQDAEIKSIVAESLKKIEAQAKEIVDRDMEVERLEKELIRLEISYRTNTL